MIGAISGIGGVTETSGPARVAGPAKAAGGDFSSVFADVAASAVGALKAGETAAIGGITGTASVHQVVQAVMNAEQALQTATALRDKLVAAYQEVSRMQI